MSWLPRKVGSWYAFESPSVYQSSSAKKSARRSVEAEPAANACAAAWKGKSSTDCMRSVVEKRDVYGLLPSATSPNMKNSGLPCARAKASTSGPKRCQNSSLTCRIVSMRKPSMPKSSTHAW